MLDLGNNPQDELTLGNVVTALTLEFRLWRRNLLHFTCCAYLMATVNGPSILYETAKISFAD